MDAVVVAKFVHEASQHASRYYCDYNIESGPKHASSMVLLKRLFGEKALIHAVGFQGHWRSGNVHSKTSTGPFPTTRHSGSRSASRSSTSRFAGHPAASSGAVSDDVVLEPRLSPLPKIWTSKRKTTPNSSPS